MERKIKFPMETVSTSFFKNDLELGMSPRAVGGLVPTVLRAQDWRVWS